MPCVNNTGKQTDEPVAYPVQPSSNIIAGTLVDHVMFQTDKFNNELYPKTLTVATDPNKQENVSNEYPPSMVLTSSNKNVYAPEDVGITDTMPTYTLSKAKGTFTLAVKGQATGAIYIFYGLKTISSIFTVNDKKTTLLVSKKVIIGTRATNVLYLTILDANFDIIEPYHWFFRPLAPIATGENGLRYASGGGDYYPLAKKDSYINTIPEHLKSIYTATTGINFNKPNLKTIDQINQYEENKKAIDLAKTKKEELEARKKSLEELNKENKKNASKGSSSTGGNNGNGKQQPTQKKSTVAPVGRGKGSSGLPNPGDDDFIGPLPPPDPGCSDPDTGGFCPIDPDYVPPTF